MKADLFEPVIYKSLRGLCSISFSLESRTDTVFDLAEMVITVDQEIRGISDTFTGSFLNNRPAETAAVFITADILIQELVNVFQSLICRLSVHLLNILVTCPVANHRFGIFILKLSQYKSFSFDRLCSA